MRKRALLLISVLSLMAASFALERCGWQAGGALCAGGLCCSEWGFCGNATEYCEKGCQSQCHNITSLIPEALFEEMLMHRNDDPCLAKGFYSYNAFISAAKSFPAFGTVGDTDTGKREIAAFLAQTSHETSVYTKCIDPSLDAWDDPYAWGYCLVEEKSPSGDYCVAACVEWPCAAGKQYYGRGPIQLKYNYNYGPAREVLNYDLLAKPDALAKDRILSFESAFWFWMTPQRQKPSCHDVITGNWTPSSEDTAAGRVPGYGVITNIINGGEECGRGYDDRVANRIGFYKRYCGLMGIEVGVNLDCYHQSPFNDTPCPLPTSHLSVT